MTDRWIVGLDGSDASTEALRWAATYARGRDTKISALGAFHVPGALALMTAKRGFGVDDLGLAATAGHAVDEAIAAVRGDGGGAADELTIEPIIVEGQPAHELVDAAATADLLVVGRRGGGELRQHALGSVSRYCATHSATPVVVVPADWVERETPLIVVGFDGSDDSSAALAWAIDFAPVGTTVRAVAAIEQSPWLAPELTLARLPEEVWEQEQRIEAAISALDPDHRVERDIALRSPRQALARASSTADLVVVGTRGHGRIAAGILGSVSTWLLHGAECPVVVVPEPQR